MGLVQLPPEAQEAVGVLKRKIQMAPVLIFPDFDNLSSLKLMPPRRGWVWYCHRNRMTGPTTPSHLGAAPLGPLKKLP